MPIIIHRDPPPVPLTPANDWDKAMGLLVMVAAAVILIEDLTIGGLLVALVNWQPVREALKPEEMNQARSMVGLLILYLGMMGLMNVVTGWGIYLKAKWAFIVGPIVNVGALVGTFVWLQDFRVEYFGLAAAVTGYCFARLAGALGPRP